MMIIFLIIALANFARCSPTSDAFFKHEVIPDVLSSNAPEKTLLVKYNSGVEANLGNILTPTQVKDQPEVKWDAEPGALYTLILCDPDATSRKNPVYREFQHWLVINIPGNDVSKGEHIAEYVGSGPPKGTGLHRYVFLLYKQSGRIEDAEHGVISKTSRQGRPGFKAAKFAEKHGLGQPIFGNLYQAEYDDYVPILHSQFG